MKIKDKRIIVVLFELIFAVCLLICFGVNKLYAQTYDYYDDGQKIYDKSKPMKDYFPFNDTVNVTRIYYPMTDELILEITMSHKLYDEDTVEFATYCAIMNFIENDKHRYYGYKIVSRTTHNNKDGSAFDLRVVKAVLKK